MSKKNNGEKLETSSVENYKCWKFQALKVNVGQKSDLNVWVQIRNLMLSGMLLTVIMTCYDDSKTAFLFRKKNKKVDRSEI